MEKDWFDYFMGTLGMLSSVGTFGAFVFLFRRDKDKQRQIDSLAALARASEEELMLSVRPDLYKNGASANAKDGLIKIDLLNRGEQTKLLEFNLTSEDVKLVSKSLPYVLEKGKERLIFAQSSQKNPNQCEYEIQLVYEDKLGNQFELDINGVGPEVTFGVPKLTKHRYEIIR